MRAESAQPGAETGDASGCEGGSVMIPNYAGTV
jgi:hypothetical protein